MTQETLTLILGAAIALISSLVTGIVNFRLASTQAKREHEVQRKEENIRLKWEEIKRDVEFAEQLIEATMLVTKEQFYLAQIQEKIEQNKANDEVRKKLQIQLEDATNRLLLYGEQHRQTYARTVWRLYSLPKDVQDSYMDFDTSVSKFFNVMHTGGSLNIMELNALGGTLMVMLRDYLAKTREEITSLDK